MNLEPEEVTSTISNVNLAARIAAVALIGVIMLATLLFQVIFNYALTHLPACEYEDSSNQTVCACNVSEAGDQIGESFIVVNYTPTKSVSIYENRLEWYDY